MGAVELVHELLDLSHVVVDDLQGDGPVHIPVVLLLQLRHLSHQLGQALLQCQQQTVKLLGLFREISVCSASTEAPVYIDVQLESNTKDIYRKRLDWSAKSLATRTFTHLNQTYFKHIFLGEAQ